MKIALVISTNDAETCWNDLRYGNFALGQGATIYACGTCIKSREQESSEMCPISTMKDMYEIIKESDRVITF